VALRDLLLCLDPTDAGEARLKLAASIARSRQVRVAGAFLVSELIPGFAPDEGFGIVAPDRAAAITPGALIAGVPAADGKRAPIMPGFGEALTDGEAVALATYLRSRFSKRPAWTDIAAELREVRERELVSGIAQGGPGSPPANR